MSEFGFITGDFEMVNPANAKYRARDASISFASENESIDAVYKPVLNYRIGAEFRHEMLRFRAGYGVQASTFHKSIEADNTITTLSAGAGVRLKKFYVDLAVVRNAGKEFRYQPYTFSDGSGPVADLKYTSLMGILTFGFSF